MPDPFKAQLRPLDPNFPKTEFPADIASRGINKKGHDMALEGYSVLERANPRDRFDRNLKGVAPPVTTDQPNVAWDEEK